MSGEAVGYIIYFTIGTIYTLINHYIRKMQDDDTLYLLWICLWPFFFIALIINWLKKQLIKIKNYVQNKFRNIRSNSNRSSSS